MGSNELCFVSKTLIKDGDAVASFPVTRTVNTKFYESDPSIYYIPVGPPVLGTYMDFGGVHLQEGELEILGPLLKQIKRTPEEQKKSYRSGTLRGVLSKNEYAVYPGERLTKRSPALVEWAHMSRKAYDIIMGLEDGEISYEFFKKTSIQHYEGWDRHIANRRAWKACDRVPSIEDMIEISQYGTDSEDLPSYFKAHYRMFYFFEPYLNTYLHEPVSAFIQERVAAFIHIYGILDTMGIRFDRNFRAFDPHRIELAHFMSLFNA